MSDFEKYDGFDAKEATEFLATVEDPDVLRAFVLHEKQNKDRSSVLTEEIIEAALAPSVGGAEPIPVEIPEGVTPGETPGWPTDEDGEPIALPASVREELADLTTEAERLRTQEGEAVNRGSDDDELTRETIAALLEERRGYEQRGEDAKIKEVDAELKRLGHKGSKRADRASTR
jgi:hypothetical protein